jgi:hypothetical protein
LFILYLPPVKSTEKNTNIPRNVCLTTLKWNETKIYIYVFDLLSQFEIGLTI